MGPRRWVWGFVLSCGLGCAAPAPQAPLGTRPVASGEEMSEWFRMLDSDSPSERDLATAAIIEAGEPVIGRVEKELDQAASAEARARLEHILREMRGPQDVLHDLDTIAGIRCELATPRQVGCLEPQVLLFRMTNTGAAEKDIVFRGLHITADEGVPFLYYRPVAPPPDPSTIKLLPGRSHELRLALGIRPEFVYSRDAALSHYGFASEYEFSMNVRVVLVADWEGRAFTGNRWMGSAFPMERIDDRKDRAARARACAFLERMLTAPRGKYDFREFQERFGALWDAGAIGDALCRRILDLPAGHFENTILSPRFGIEGPKLAILNARRSERSSADYLERLVPSNDLLRALLREWRSAPEAVVASLRRRLTERLAADERMQILRTVAAATQTKEDDAALSDACRRALHEIGAGTGDAVSAAQVLKEIASTNQERTLGLSTPLLECVESFLSKNAKAAEQAALLTFEVLALLDDAATAGLEAWFANKTPLGKVRWCDLAGAAVQMRCGEIAYAYGNPEDPRVLNRAPDGTFVYTEEGQQFRLTVIVEPTLAFWERASEGARDRMLLRAKDLLKRSSGK